jgi:GT2 family glycosyltransferase
LNNQFISVIIPTYHDWDRLKLCLDALSNQILSQESFEVIVVNNDPKNLVPFSTNVSNVIFVDEDKQGSYAARNKGLSLAKGDIIAFTDSDCIPEANWLSNALEVFNKNPDACRIAGRIKLFSNSKENNAILFERVFAFKQKQYAERLGTALTANLLVKKKLFHNVGLFNDQLMSGGDVEWGIRARNAGFPIVFSENVQINHPARESVQELIEKRRRTAEGIIKIKIQKGERVKKTPIAFQQLLTTTKDIISVLFINREKLCLTDRFKVVIVKIKLDYHSVVAKLKTISK